ncbi:MAG: S8 family serine peptidase [Planctomycetota bacterium]|nr:S8 family serine peptidase [Planctomycetota bacterium]
MKMNARRFRKDSPLILEVLERRDVPALVLDYDLVSQKPADFSQTSVLIQLPTGAMPDFKVGAYAPGLQLVKGYALVPNLYEAHISDHSLASTLQSLQGSSQVKMVQPDSKITAKIIPNDPSFSQLYGMNNTGQTGGNNDADIDAPEAWDKTTGTGQTIVAVIDTGVDYNHPELRDNIWTNPGEIAGNGRDDDNNGYIDDIHGYDFANNDANPMDDNGHGTHVSGTIGAVGNNSTGVAGVNWHTSIMALKFLDASGSGFLSTAISALDYAVANGARLSNNSWGGGGFDATLGLAIANAGAKGHIFVAAAGNSFANNDLFPNYPSNYNYDNIVAVAATDNRDNLAGFSNFGVTTVDIAAPGVNILSTVLNGGYATYSGTSMATPHVTGALSLYWDANPGATYTQVINALYQGADVVPSLQGLVAGAKRLNLNGLLGGSVTPPVDVAGAKVTVGQFTQTGGLATGATLTFSEAINPASFTTADLALTGPAGTVSITSVVAVAGSGNTKFAVVFPALSAVGTYTLKVGPAVLDTAGNEMDQDGNGTNGQTTDAFSMNWVISATPPADVTGPRITTGVFILSNGLATGATLTFSEAILVSSFTKVDVTLTGPNGKITINSVALITGSGNKVFKVTFPALQSNGTYTLKVGPAILDTASNPMDQNGDGTNGGTADAFQMDWIIKPPVDLKGARVVDGVFTQTAGYATGGKLTFSEAIDVASFTIADLVLLGPGGTFSITSVLPVSGSGGTQFVVAFPALTAVGTYTLKVGPGVLDLAGNLMDQNNNGVNGEVGDLFSMSYVQNSQLIFTNTTDYNIRDWKTTSSTITVDQNFTIADLNLRLNVNHTAVGDLDIMLITPFGQPLFLMGMYGGVGDNLINTLFDDQAALHIGQGSAPFTGSYYPDDALSAVNGRSAKGNWTLKISDYASRDEGTLLDWSLEFSTSSQITTRGVKPVVTIYTGAPSLQGGALLSIAPADQSGSQEVVQALPRNQAVPTTSPSQIQAWLDKSVWSRLIEDNLVARKRIGNHLSW